MSLPVVDYTAKDAPQQFVKSLRETGFGVLTNHPIKQSLVESIYNHWQAFFNSDDKHNFAFDVENDQFISATTNYSTEIISAVEKDNIFGTQFHPEKSQANGIKILENFVKLK